MLVHVDLEALAIALQLPVGNSVADTVQQRTTSQVEVTNQHSTEMADVTDIVSTESEGSKKFQRGHDNDEPAHAQLDRNREQDDLSIGKQNRAGEQDPKNRAGGADGRRIGWLLTPENGNRFDGDVDEP